jgi:mevalonate kinase
MVVYPERHPHAVELRAKKTEVDELYKSIHELTEEARKHYQQGFQEFKLMGEKHKSIHDKLKELAVKLEELEDITVKPTI